MNNPGTPETGSKGPTEAVIAAMDAILRGEEPPADPTSDQPDGTQPDDGDMTSQSDDASEPADADNQATSEPIAKPRLEWPKHLRDKVDSLTPEAREILEEAYRHQHAAATKEYSKKITEAQQTVQKAKSLLGEAKSALVPLDPTKRYRNPDGTVMSPDQQAAYNKQWVSELHSAAESVGVDAEDLFSDPSSPASVRMLELWKKGYDAIDAVRLVAAEHKPAKKAPPSRPPRGSASQPATRKFNSVEEHMDAILRGEVRE